MRRVLDGLSPAGALLGTRLQARHCPGLAQKGHRQVPRATPSRRDTPRARDPSYSHREGFRFGVFTIDGQGNCSQGWEGRNTSLTGTTPGRRRTPLVSCFPKTGRQPRTQRLLRSGPRGGPGADAARPGRAPGGCPGARALTETPSPGQPFAFNCSQAPPTSAEAQATWHKYPGGIPVSQSRSSRIYQDQTWILFLPVAPGDSGIYQCVINDTNMCPQIHLNLTVLEKHWCNSSRDSQMNVSGDYKQILHVGKDESLTCHLNFPKSFDVDSIKWYKDCKKVKGGRFTHWKLKLSVSDVSAEDGGDYACEARLSHAGRQYSVSHRIAVSVAENFGDGRRIPSIIYPINNTIEAQLGSALVVNCNITDTRDNTNLRCWKVGTTLVDVYYQESRRIQEGNETQVSSKEENFYTVSISFSEVRMEDYGHPFTCHAGVSAAYFILRPPVPDFRAHLIGGLLALAGAAVFVVCVCSVLRIDIALWYRSAFHSAETVEDGKLYDAYVLYPKPPHGRQCPTVATLALQALPEVLERQCGYKLFIFGRDEFPGQAVANVIDENVKLCRRLIIIVPESLSFDLLKNMPEEQIAVYNALIQDGMKVILIEVERVKNYTSMPESIQYIKQKHGSVQWSRDFTEESWCAKAKFWKKVRYRMPPKRFPPPSLASC
ncbi:PREDICTED: interleukin-1 receptor-like 2 [Miniopterus natalensis]|uniref:interleukin-1 receptor-like 2 n=1 Tax=Miniopterus natalensis TaxID=291302 RepID=UPI0007A6D791|nr:PREDICTED: interleukin-1 receptor-like 2 [Miniopterus natalensis]